MWWKSVEKGSYSEDIVHNHLKAGGKIVFDAGKGVYVEYKEGGSVDEAIRTLSRKPELAWMADLQIRNDVEWNAVKVKFDQWNYKAEGLTQGAAALIALAVTIATQGAASGLAGAITGATAAGAQATLAQVVLTKALSAGMTSLASKAAVSLVNNKGDIGKVLKELGSSASIKSLITTMLTAQTKSEPASSVMLEITPNHDHQSVHQIRFAG